MHGFAAKKILWKQADFQAAKKSTFRVWVLANKKDALCFRKGFR
jgi:hypothetical protein